MSASDSKLLRVGELAKCTGKTVRAVHLYEELGLLRPAMRSEGGFRLYHPDAIARIDWVVKLQAVGFTLPEIQELVKQFESAPSGRAAATGARRVFADKLSDIRKQIASLQVIENDIVEALGYLDACQDCSLSFRPTECKDCSHQGHERGSAPPLFANLSRTAAGECGQVGERAQVAASAPSAHDVAASEPGKPAADVADHAEAAPTPEAPGP
ncbi:MAG TPA: MerR family transcriptional regulator [Haliangium sp.]|nr:MerR family transcriptional regulator [Haliangium sp.]